VHWFGRYAGYPNWNIPTSRLAVDMIAFLFIEQEYCQAIINGVTLSLKTGDLLVIKGADAFEFSHDSAHPHRNLSTALALKQSGVANQLLHRNFKRRYSIKKPELYVAEFEKVLTTFAQEGAFRDLAISGAIMQWLAYLLHTLRPPMARTSLELRTVVDRVLAAEAWAMSRLGEKITIDAWSRAVRLNADYFGRIFKRETGKRPMEWLNEQRLQMVAQLLANTHKSVGEISETCGFTNPFYLSRLFKMHYGIAPRGYRKSHG
jgi:AraC-like DNA-binding protein